MPASAPPLEEQAELLNLRTSLDVGVSLSCFEIKRLIELERKDALIEADVAFETYELELSKIQGSYQSSDNHWSPVESARKMLVDILNGKSYGL